MRSCLCALLVCAAGFSARAAAHTQAKLLLGAESAKPGDTVLAGVMLHMDTGWHTYWKNPGASGQATSIKWHLPPGVTAGEIQWPLPEKLPDKEFTTYIYNDDVVLLVPLTLGANLAPGPLEVKADVSWLECSAASCVPGKGAVEAALNIGTETKPSKETATLAAWEKRLPGQGGALEARAWWEGPATGDSRPLLLEWKAPGKTAGADFLPNRGEQFEVKGPTEQVPSAPGTVRLRKQVTKFEGGWPAEISGVALQGQGAGREGFAISAKIEAQGAAAASAAAAGPAAGFSQPVWLMIVYAFFGGIILNVLPCVLPVIALKILGFVNQAKEDPRRVRRLALVYTAGVLVSFLAMAGLVIGLKAAGRSVGWGFQFSSPYFLVAMTVLAVLVALNLFGIFEVTPGGRALSAASALSAKHGAAGAFFNGLLATVLATSCTAPVLGTAVGFAFTQSAGLILLILLMVGLGLAAPYLVLSWNPAWLKFLPRPGPWMEKFKIAMGFPMLGAGVWLCSLLTIHYGERAWWMAVFLVFLGVAAWVYGEFVQRGRKHRALAALISALVLAGGYFYALETELRWRQPNDGAMQTAQAARANEEPGGLSWQAWSPAAVAQARAEGRPVLVDFTARWCLTCNTIVKPAIESASVQAKLKEINAVPLLANYTLEPPSITAELNRFGRAGVPLVLVYPRDPAAPPMVFDLVTPGSLVEALDRAAK